MGSMTRRIRVSLGNREAAKVGAPRTGYGRRMHRKVAAIVAGLRALHRRPAVSP